MLSIVAHTCNSELGRLRQKSQEVKASLGYIASSRPAWDRDDTVEKGKEKEEEQGREEWKE